MKERGRAARRLVLPSLFKEAVPNVLDSNMLFLPLPSTLVPTP